MFVVVNSLILLNVFIPERFSNARQQIENPKFSCNQRKKSDRNNQLNSNLTEESVEDISPWPRQRQEEEEFYASIKKDRLAQNTRTVE